MAGVAHERHKTPESIRHSNPAEHWLQIAPLFPARFRDHGERAAYTTARHAAGRIFLNLRPAVRHRPTWTQTPAIPSGSSTPLQSRRTSGPPKLPSDSGQYFEEYDLKPYTKELTSVDRPQQAVVDFGCFAKLELTPGLLNRLVFSVLTEILSGFITTNRCTRLCVASTRNSSMDRRLHNFTACE